MVPSIRASSHVEQVGVVFLKRYPYRSASSVSTRGRAGLYLLRIPRLADEDGGAAMPQVVEG